MQTIGHITAVSSSWKGQMVEGQGRDFDFQDGGGRAQVAFIYSCLPLQSLYEVPAPCLPPAVADAFPAELQTQYVISKKLINK